MTEEYQRKPTPSRDERGIHWNKSKWAVQLVIEGQRYYLGRFVLKRDAIIARDNFLIAYYTRSPK